MTVEFFEGAAGTGKTHNIVETVATLVSDGALHDGQKVLALTFMNGARHRLDQRLSGTDTFRKRYACQTFDVFARALVARRRSLISTDLQADAAALNEFDGPCYLAASLLADIAVRQWVARTFPVVLVDEAQDLDTCRMRILHELSRECRIVAGADNFQCLKDGYDTGPVIEWLEGAGRVHRLTQPRRTKQRGLLAAALAVREGRDITRVLQAYTFNKRTTWKAQGFRLLKAPAKNANHALLAWSIANEIDQHKGSFAILTPDASSTIIRNALTIVGTKTWIRKTSGLTFGPYPHVWDRRDGADAEDLLAGLSLPETISYADALKILTPLSTHFAIIQTINRIDRLRRVRGQLAFAATEIIDFVHAAVLSRSRLGLRQHKGHLAMTIQRAKNREFPNVIVLWPHSATGSPEHLRKLLYNAITRAQNHCTVIVLGRGRLLAPPFAPMG
jgi:superfamily I DNA/RNA helicase